MLDPPPNIGLDAYLLALKLRAQERVSDHDVMRLQDKICPEFSNRMSEGFSPFVDAI